MYRGIFPYIYLFFWTTIYISLYYSYIYKSLFQVTNLQIYINSVFTNNFFFREGRERNYSLFSLHQKFKILAPPLIFSLSPVCHRLWRWEKPLFYLLRPSSPVTPLNPSSKTIFIMSGWLVDGAYVECGSIGSPKPRERAEVASLPSTSSCRRLLFGVLSEALWGSLSVKRKSRVWGGGV